MPDTRSLFEVTRGDYSVRSIEELHARMVELQQIGQIGSWYYEPSSQTTWWSGEMYRLYGILPTSRSPTFHEFLQLVHPSDRVMVETTFLESVKSSQDFRSEFRIVRPDSVVMWIECRAQAKKINGLLRIEGTNQDITLRKQREIELSQSESRLRLAFDQMLEGFQVIDEDYRYVYLNYAAAKHGKKERAELIGKTMLEVYPGFQETPAFAAIQRCMVERLPILMESRFTYADLSTRVFELSIQPCNEGVMVLSFDITDRVEAERRLVLKERELEAFFETSNVGMSEWRFDGLLVRANETCCRLLGYSREELMQLKFFDLIMTEDRSQSRHLLGELASGKINHYETHRRYLRKDGSILHSQVYVTAIRIGDERPSTFAVVLIDITSQVQLEEQFRQSQKLEAIGRLAGGVAHDFNNLLTIIQTSSDVALADPQLGHSARDSLTAIAAAAKRGAGLTQQLLAFSRRQLMDMQQLDPNEVIRSASLLLHRVAGELVELRFDLEAKIPTVKGDRGQLEQVLMNLVANARDAVEPSGVISIKTRYLRDYRWSAITGTENGGEGAVEILVVDNGCGMREEILSRIFEPFFTTKAAGKGTGLGLAVVHGVIDQFRGLVEVESTVDVGTTMRLLFPVVAQSTFKMREIIPAQGFAGNESILVVDDEPEICDVCKRFLKTQGYQVHVATSPTQAIHLMEIERLAVDLLLTDVVMPGMTGIELADYLKRRLPMDLYRSHFLRCSCSVKSAKLSRRRFLHLDRYFDCDCLTAAAIGSNDPS